MNGRLLYLSFCICLCISGLSQIGIAQTITINALSSNSVCAGTGGSFFVPFSTTGAFAAGNTFTAQLSDANGVFSGTTLTIGTLRASPQTATTNTITATIPSTLVASSSYKIRVISSTPSKTSTNSQSVFLNAPPSQPVVTIPAPYCKGDTAKPLIATPTAGGTLNWYGTNSNSIPTSTATVPDTRQATAGTLYYVSQTVNGCTSSKVAIQVIVRDKPTAPLTGSKAYCLGESAIPLSATATSGATLNWYTGPVGGTASTIAPTPPTTRASSTAYYVSQSIGSCESPRASVVVTVNSLPDPPKISTPPSICQGATAAPLTATATTGAVLRWWGTNATGGSYTNTATIPSNQASGTYYVSQFMGSCESPRVAISMTVTSLPALPSVPSSVSYCQNSTTQPLIATAATGGKLNWYGTNATGGTASTNAPTPTAASVGTIVYYVSQSIGSCESPRTTIPIQVKANPATPAIFSPVLYCQSQPANPLRATAATGGTLNWYGTNATGGTASTNAPTPPVTTAGSLTYYVSQSVGGCESPRTGIVATVNPLPAAPSVSNLTYCQVQKEQPSQNIPALTAVGQNLRWYASDGNPYTNAPTPPVSQTGTFSFQVTQTVNSCESSKATLQVTVKTIPAPATPKPVVSYCIDEKAAPLEAVGDAGSTLRWVDPYGRDTTLTPVPPTLNVNVQPGGDIYYVYQVNTSGCYSARSAIRVIVNAIPTLSLTGSANVNLGQSTPLRLTFTGNPPFSYTITGGYSGISNKADTTISVLPRGTTTYQVTGVTNSCGVGLPGNPATAIITVNTPTVTTGALSTSSLCAGTSLPIPFTTTGTFMNGNVFSAELISTTDTTKKYDLQTTGTSSPITATTSSTLASGQYYVRVKASNPNVGVIGSTSPTILTIRSKPTATLIGSQTIAEGTPASLTVTFMGDGPWTIAYVDSLRSYSAIATTNPYILEARPARTIAYRLTSVSNDCGAGTASGSATVTVNAVLGIEDNSLDPLIHMYPVPVINSLTIDIDVPLGRTPAEISLINLQGVPIYQTTTRNRQTDIDLTSQPAGLYLVRVQVGDRQSIRKIVKQ